MLKPNLILPSPYRTQGKTYTRLTAINSAAMTTKAYGGKETLGSHLDEWHISSHCRHHMGYCLFKSLRNRREKHERSCVVKFCCYIWLGTILYSHIAPVSWSKNLDLNLNSWAGLWTEIWMMNEWKEKLQGTWLIKNAISSANLKSPVNGSTFPA